MAGLSSSMLAQRRARARDPEPSKPSPRSKNAKGGEEATRAPASIDEPSVQDMAAMIERALSERGVSWQVLLRLSRWREQSSDEHKDERALAQRYFLRVLDVFKEERGEVDVALFAPIGGVYLLPSGELRMTLRNSDIRFDWTKAQPYMVRISALGDQARDWWSQAGNIEPGKGNRWQRRRARQSAIERRPHSQRAYGMATWFLALLNRENARHATSSNIEPAAATGQFGKELMNLEVELKRAEGAFQLAAQRSAQVRYGRGMLRGIGALAAICLLVGAAFFLWDVPAAYGIAIPAGGLGATVSVLQRMSSGRFRLDYEAAGDLLYAFGAVRPLIGAIFGIAITALLEGALLPAVDIPSGKELAFYGALGFLAGFNERFAQDMLVGSAKRITATASEENQGTSRP